VPSARWSNRRQSRLASVNAAFNRLFMTAAGVDADLRSNRIS